MNQRLDILQHVPKLLRRMDNVEAALKDFTVMAKKLEDSIEWDTAQWASDATMVLSRLPLTTDEDVEAVLSSRIYR